MSITPSLVHKQGILAETTPWEGGNATRALNEHYTHATRVNSHVLAWEKHVFASKSLGIWRIPANTTTDGTVVDGTAVDQGESADAPIIVGAHNEVGPALAFLVGQFQLADGRRALMLQNQDDRFNAIPSISFDDSKISGFLWNAIERSKVP